MKKLFYAVALTAITLIASCEKNENENISAFELSTDDDQILKNFIKIYEDPTIQDQILRNLIASEKPVVFEDLLNNLEKSLSKTDNVNVLKNSVVSKRQKNPLQITEISLLNQTDDNELGISSQIPKYFAFVSNEKNSEIITAYDLKGNKRTLNIEKELDGPIIILDDYGNSSLDLMIANFNKSNAQKLGNNARKQFPAELILKKIRLKDDHEPFHRGAAEIYGVLIGFDRGLFDIKNDPTFTLVNMDYLDYDHTNYYRNDVLMKWWGADTDHVGLVIMEYDGNYPAFFDHNLKNLFQQGQFSSMTEKQALKIITKAVANKLNNYDDYVDQFYYFPKFESELNYKGLEQEAEVRLINTPTN